MPDSPVTALLARARDGDASALPGLVDLLQDELRRLASAHMRRERRDHTLQTTALVNEVCLRLLGRPDDQPAQWQDRRHFLRAAAQAMRRILLQHARDRRRLKRGGDRRREPLDEPALQISEPDVDLLALNDALDRLAALDPAKVQLVELRYFAGLTLEEAADVQGVSLATLKREWQVARAWLYREMRPDGEPP